MRRAATRIDVWMPFVMREPAGAVPHRRPQRDRNAAAPACLVSLAHIGSVEVVGCGTGKEYAVLVDPAKVTLAQVDTAIEPSAASTVDVAPVRAIPHMHRGRVGAHGIMPGARRVSRVARDAGGCMVIVSIVKQVPAAEAHLRLADGVPDVEGVTFVLDGMDEYGVEQALRTREAGAEAELVALGYGPEGSDHVVRTALAMGLDRGVQLEGPGWDDPLAVARALAEVVRELDASLVFVGGKQADWDSAALGPALAEALGWPHVDWTTRFRLDGASFEAVHDVDDGSERVRGELPVVVTTQQGLNEPRFPTLPSIMKARRKPLDARRAEATSSPLEVRSYRPLERDRRRVVLEGDARAAAVELVRRLRSEAKVL